jgi:hypothetical protein
MNPREWKPGNTQTLFVLSLYTDTQQNLHKCNIHYALQENKSVLLFSPSELHTVIITFLSVGSTIMQM